MFLSLDILLKWLSVRLRSKYSALSILLHFILNFMLFFYHQFYYGFILIDLVQASVSRMSSQNSGLVFSWWSSLAVALNFGYNRPQYTWMFSALFNVSVFMFMGYINLKMQRFIQNLVKQQMWSFFGKGVNSSWYLLVFVKNLLLGCFSSESTSRIF